jgi:Fic-DOC domain mobile mystery protein B
VTLLPEAEGTTPISYEEADQLIPDWIETRSQLNQAEAEAIARAVATLPAALTVEAILNVSWLQDLHRRMFRDVWRWAGQFRRKDLNIGVEWYQVVPSFHDAMADARLWFDAMDLDEAAIRLHHRLVAIHPFANGNGRWSRIAADECAARSGARRFTWGATLPREDQRPAYLTALRRADDDLDVTDLLVFARS